MRSLKHNQAHISTQYVMGKEIAENPQISIYYNDREHVKIYSTNLSQLSALSQCYTQTSMESELVTGSNPLHKSAYLYCTIQVD